jgi:ParB-like chromosome segregation protein Spo0J
MMSDIKVHPHAEIFPEMSEAELADFADDIREHGLLEPIEMHTGMLLDGRHRYQACLISGVEPRYVDKTNEVEDTLSYVTSKNALRRHLTRQQKVMIVAKVASQKKEQGVFRSTKEAMEEMGDDDISEREVQYGKVVEEFAIEELKELVNEDIISVRLAATQAQLDPERQLDFVKETIVQYQAETEENGSEKKAKKKTKAKATKAAKAKKVEDVGADLEKLRAPYKEIEKDVRSIRKRIADLAKSDGGFHVNQAVRRLRQNAADISAIMRQLTPAGFCGKCKREGCERCCGVGFLTVGQIEAMRGSK